MLTNEWLAQLEKNEVILRNFVANWHPSAQFPRVIQNESVLMKDGTAVAIPVPEAFMPITAPMAEQACQRVRQSIRQETPEDPLLRWDNALKSKDIIELINLLNEAWFGVPESTSCWGIKGFKEAVELLEDPPEQEEEIHDNQTAS